MMTILPIMVASSCITCKDTIVLLSGWGGYATARYASVQ